MRAGQRIFEAQCSFFPPNDEPFSNGVDVLQQCSVERTQATINVHQVSLIQRPGNGTKKTWARGAAYINLRRASLLSASWERDKSPWARAHEPRPPPPKCHKSSWERDKSPWARAHEPRSQKKQIFISPPGSLRAS